MKENEAKQPTTDEPVHPKLIGRAKFLIILACTLFALLLLRILLLQTVGYSRYQQKVIDQMTTEVSVSASRGTIYDANGVVLATNVSTYRIFISPSSIASEQSELDKMGENIKLDELIAEHLSSILDVTYDFVLKQTTYTKYLDRTIKNEVDEKTADLVRAFIDEYNLQYMIYLQTTSTRYYPYSSLASHVLGFTGSDGSGLYGLEFSYNDLSRAQTAGTLPHAMRAEMRCPTDIRNISSPRMGTISTARSTCLCSRHLKRSLKPLISSRAVKTEPRVL